MADAKHFESIFRSDLFDGKVVLVTGGGTGIGRCTAHELAALGASVVIGARRPEPLAKTAAEISDAGGRCHVVSLNIRDEKSVDDTIAGIVAQHGRLDGLVNNAGGQFVAPLGEMSANGWRTVIDLNLNSSFLLCNAAYRHWMKENGGAIVNMLADIWTGHPGMGHMSAARAGIENLSWTLAVEWAAADIRVNCVAPGAILSSGMLTYPPAVQVQAVQDVSITPPARLGSESEVSAAIVFLLSPAAAFVSGATLMIDGGQRFHKNLMLPVGKHQGTTRWDGFHLKPDLRGTPFEKLNRAE
jgi:citronellol/citronellal dehydrogenase